MSDQGDLLIRFRKTICGVVKTQLPSLKKCEPYAGPFNLEELKKSGIRTPAVLVSLLGAKPDTNHAQAPAFNLNMSAFVVTKDALGLDRDVAAANICGALLALIPNKNWSEGALGGATKVAMHSLVTSKTRDVAASLWAVTWDQPITFYNREEGPLGAELYVGQAPNIGAANESDYEPATEGEG